MIIRSITTILAAATLASCGSSCNALSGRQPAHCEGATAVGLAIAAPVLVPAAIIDDVKADAAPIRPVEKFVPRTERERELYRAAGGT